MERDLSRYPVTVRRILQNEDSLIGFFVTWFLAFTVFPAGAFYVGTICSPGTTANGMNHYSDLRITDMHFGGWFALGGLSIGIFFGLWMTFMYPMFKEREAAEDKAREEELHHSLSHHEEISTDIGQKAEHESQA